MNTHRCAQCAQCGQGVRWVQGCWQSSQDGYACPSSNGGVHSPDDAPEPLGYLVVTRTGDQWYADWDGTIHPTAADATREVAEARAGGHDAKVTVLMPIIGDGGEVDEGG